MTEQDKSLGLGHSNIRIFYDIARESLEQMNKLIESGRHPKPNGEPDWIVTFDPDQKSFKAALSVIIFSGVFLEALLHLLIVEKHGIAIFRKYDKGKKYEEKLILLECTDPLIIEECKHYRTVRREVVHEKAYLDKEMRWVQKEAARAFKFIEFVNAYFGVNGRFSLGG